MSVQTPKKRNISFLRRIAILEREIKTLRASVVSASVDKDPEGEYRPEFVKEILASLKEKPTHRFKDKKSFLRHIRSA